MKLHEIAFVIGDDGGIHFHIDKAIKNMKYHGKNHKDAASRVLCKTAAENIATYTQNPSAIYDDPHTLLKILSIFHGEPDNSRITHALDTMGSYTQSDSD